MAEEAAKIEEEVQKSPYDEEAFNKMVEGETEEQPKEPDPEGAKEDDGEPDIKSEAKPKGEQESKDLDTDDPPKDKEDKPELPAWMEAIPEDQRDDAVTDFLRLHEDIEKISARYDAQHNQLKPTQQRLARVEERLKLISMIKPGDDLSERSAKIDTWIEKHGEDFPDEAADLKASIDAYRKTVSTIEGDAEKYRSTLERDDKVDQTKERDNLARMDADVGEINASPAFAEYLKQHPEHSAQVKSPYAHDVIEVVDKFREDTEWQPPMRSEDFLYVNQMLVSPVFEVWSRAIGLHGVENFNDADQAKVFHQFKVDLDAANQDGSDNGDSEAIKLKAQRDKRKKDVSPAARPTGTGGGKAAALHGEAYFDSLPKE